MDLDLTALKFFNMILFGFILYIPANIFSVMLGQVFLGWTSTKQGLISLAQGHNTCCRWGSNLQPFYLKSSNFSPLKLYKEINFL